MCLAWSCAAIPHSAACLVASYPFHLPLAPPSRSLSPAAASVFFPFLMRRFLFNPASPLLASLIASLPPAPLSCATGSISLPSHDHYLRLVPLPPALPLRSPSFFFTFLSLFASRPYLRCQCSSSSVCRDRPSLSLRIPCLAPCLSSCLSVSLSIKNTAAFVIYLTSSLSYLSIYVCFTAAFPSVL